MPRRIAGGDRRRRGRQCGVLQASTMPRRIAGGDKLSPTDTAGGRTCFNDAPANCRGRRLKMCDDFDSTITLQRCPGELPGETKNGMFVRGFEDGLQRCPGELPGETARAPALARRAADASTMPRRIAGGDSMAPTHRLPKRDSTNCERCRNIAWPTARATGSGLQIVKEHDAPQ